MSKESQQCSNNFLKITVEIFTAKNTGGSTKDEIPRIVQPAGGAGQGG